MVGYNQESKKTSNFYGYVTDLYLNDAPIIDWANTKQKLEEEATIWAVQGAFFRLNYDYAGKYLVEVNGRYDGSSNMHQTAAGDSSLLLLWDGDFQKKSSLNQLKRFSTM